MAVRRPDDNVNGVLDIVRSALAPWPGAGVIVAVSGGSDSVALLRLLTEVGPQLGLRLTVAHLNHGVRGDAANADVSFVHDLAGTLGVPFALGSWTPTRPGHFEADARRARYRWLTTIARSEGASIVVTGHTKDDQAETILHRILRGTGPRGLAGIPSRRMLTQGVILVRPLLTVTRAALRAYLAGLGQDFREDATNRDLSRTRGRIREDLLPKLAAEYNPSVTHALARLGQLAHARERAFRRFVRRIERRAVISAASAEVSLDRHLLEGLDDYMRAEVLREVWRRQGWPEAGMTAAQWRRMAAVVVSNQRARADAGAGIELSVETDVIVLTRPVATAPVPRPALVVLPIPGSVVWGAGRVIASVDADVPGDEQVDYDCLVPPLIVRGPEPGDRFDPLGMNGRTQPLNDFFRGRGVTKAKRLSVPLVCDSRGIVWVVGHRIADRVRRTATTSRCLSLRWESESGS